MYLKTLKIAGFKSFADRTRLDLERGVTVVVGPNGSGKSNIVDAIAWVMGTQSAKSLRTEKMDDVIFAGTAVRPALGRAEVTLIFDNESGTLALDMPEVTITRRLYRDGSSDYEINGVGCRLIDVQELISDSGVGRHQHMIVGQGRLDSILNAKPEDHRAVIEEAAGILKHRQRKDRSQRRLERTDADVLRLLDILKELKRQLRPLKRQALNAERYDGLRDEIFSLRLFLSGEELRSIADRQGATSQQDTELSAQLAESERDLLLVERSLEPLSLAASEAGTALDRDTAAAAQLETTVERLRSIVQVTAERSRSLSARLKGADERRADLVTESEELDVNLRISVEREEQTAMEQERSERVLSALEEEERSLAEQESMPTEGAVAIVRGDLRALQSAADRDSRERGQITQRLAALRIQLEDETAEITRISDEIQVTDGLTSEAQRNYEEAKIARAGDQEAWETAQESARHSGLELAGANAKVEALETAVAGLADSTARQHAEVSPSYRGSLNGLLDIPESLTAAVDAALGPFADAIILTDGDGVKEVVAQMKSSGFGGISMVVNGLDTSQEAIRELALDCGLDPLVDLLGPNVDRPLALTLLGDVVVAEGWLTGWDVVQMHPALRVVTPEGDLISMHGVRVAHPDGAIPSVLETARAALKNSTDLDARSRSLLNSAHRAFDARRGLEREKLDDLEGLEARLAGSTETLDRITRRRGSREEETIRLDSRLSAIEEGMADREEQISRLEQRLAALEGEEAERQKAWEELAARRQEVATRRDEARRIRNQAAADYGAVIERKKMLERRIEEVQSELLDLDAHPADPFEIARLKSVEAQARRALAVVRAHIDTLRERQIVLRERSGKAGKKLGTARARREEFLLSVASSKDVLAHLAVEIAELKVRHESVAERLRRDADASVYEALQAPRPVLDTENLPAALASRENELRRMGPVNPLAAQEYGELNERHEFLSNQLSDLEDSRNELRKVIAALEEQIYEQFLAAFEEVTQHYIEFFEVLFPGGKGSIVLTDPNEPGTSGVDIKAQPLGKKVSRLQLLSGGERSLAALAFLFAVFKARPSPFYLMDEVEAALDATNLRRFLKLVDAFRGSAQLVVVTHQQQTVEAADVLYGVTMEPGGSSKVIAKRMSGQLIFEEA